MTQSNKFKIKNDLRDIIFCQELYRHLVGVMSDNSLLENLKRKCLDLSLYSKMIQFPIVAEVPKLLITDFNNMAIISYKAKSWNLLLQQSLQKFYKNVRVIDLDGIIVDTFKSTKIYFEKYNLLDGENEDDDNERLFILIQKYMDLREELGNFDDALERIYCSKQDALFHIIETYLQSEFDNLLRLEDSVLYIQLRSLKTSNVEQVIESYRKKFIEPSSSLIRSFDADSFNFNKLSMFLRQADKSGPAIDRFIQHEMDLLKRESYAAREFLKDIETNDPMKIGICSILPFAFLENPFPLV